MEFKTLPTETQVNTDRREVTAYASVFDVMDRVGDIVRPGAFLKSLKIGLDRVAYKHNHDRLIGRPLSAEEDSKGLLTVARVSKTPLGDEMLELMRDGSLSTYSFKYAVPKGKSSRGADGSRNLHELKLFEFGPVDPDLACNPETSIISVKGVQMFNVWDFVDAMAAYLRGIDAGSKADMTPDEIKMLTRVHEAARANVDAMKALLEQGEATPSEQGAATQSQESDGNSISPIAVLALATAARERMSITARMR